MVLLFVVHYTEKYKEVIRTGGCPVSQSVSNLQTTDYFHICLQNFDRQNKEKKYLAYYIHLYILDINLGKEINEKPACTVTVNVHGFAPNQKGNL